MGQAVTTWRQALILLALAVSNSNVAAHQLDECVQSTLVAIEPSGIRLGYQLAPGIEVAEQVTALIDASGDDTISADEAAAYAKLVGRDLKVQMDDGDSELVVEDVNVPPPSELRSGSGIIQVEFSIGQLSLAAGRHRLTLENVHRPAASVYLVNAARPKSELIQIDSQSRNRDQSIAQIDFTVSVPARSRMGIAIGVVAALVLAALAAAKVWRNRAVSGSADQ
jgi:hypothetical protein